jgi:hypothetical protein
MDHAFRVVARGREAAEAGTDVRRLARAGAMRAVHGSRTLEDFQKGMENFAARHTTTDMSKAARDANGDYLVVHKRELSAYGKEAQRSATFLTKLYKYPTQAWKYAVLATRPAYFVNNAVGNTFMAMATLGPVGFARGLVDAYRQVHGEARRRSRSRARQGAHELHGDWQDKWYLGVHQGFGQEAMQQLSLNEASPGTHEKTAKVVQVAEQGFYPITHKVADVFLRRVMINSLMREHPRCSA